MRTMVLRRARSGIGSWCRLAVLVVAAGLSGCGTMQFESGRKVNAEVLEQSLKTGVSTVADVKQVLGEPFGQGRALMPFHETPRTVWTYYYEQGSADLGSGEMHDRRLYLFVFLVDNRYDGYMWFASTLQ